MYCTKCGKQIDYDSPICKECVDEMAVAAAPAETLEPEAEQSVIEQTELQPGESAEVAPANLVVESAPSPVAQPTAGGGNPRMRGFGKALAGCIVGFVATIISVVVYMVGMVTVLSAYEGGADIARMAAILVFFEILSIVPAIIAVVMGVRSVKFFKATPRELPKPIATLVVGIHAIFFGGFAILYSGIFMFVLMMMLLMPV